MSWGSLGSVQFEPLAGPTDFSARMSVEYAEQSLVGRKPVLQAVGDKLDELTLQIRVHYTLNADVQASVKAITQALRDHQVLSLVLGTAPDAGIYAGEYVLTDLSQTIQELWPDGTLKWVEMSLTLKEWVEDANLQVSARQNPPPAIRPKKTGTPAPATQAYTRNDQGQIVPSGGG